MRHRVAHRKLGRVSQHRIAMLRNQAQALLRHERIRTTVPRAKELRPFVERLITIAKRGLASGENGRVVYARRLVRRDLANQAVVRKLFDRIAPRFASRAGGYTRLLRIGRRRGDNAELAQVELLGSEYSPEAEAATRLDAVTTPEPKAEPKKKGVGGRLRAAAQRMRGRGTQAAKAGQDEAPGETGKTTTRRSRTAGNKKASPRKKSD